LVGSFQNMAWPKTTSPPFLSTWLDRSLLDCIFSLSQIRIWTSAHLQGVRWYLECGPLYVPEVKAELFKSLEPFGIDVAIDGKFVGLDPDTLKKAIAKLKANDLNNNCSLRLYKKSSNINLVFKGLDF
jgi:hypothetical protein